MEKNLEKKKKTNVILAVVLGLVALAFYVSGIYLSSRG
jgi:flagellar basal body-associated protein FliL